MLLAIILEIKVVIAYYDKFQAILSILELTLKNSRVICMDFITSKLAIGII